MDSSDDITGSLEESIESSVNTSRCRICWRTAYITDMISPCMCSGTQKYTHFQCLQRWIEERDSTNNDICDVCQQPYQQIEIKKYRKTFGQWLREGEDVSAKIATTFILISFFVYLINMGCIQFVISEHKIHAVIRFIQLILIIFFTILFFIIFLVSIYVFIFEFKEWQKTHLNIVVKRMDGSISRRSSGSSILSYQSSESDGFTAESQNDTSDQSRRLMDINEVNQNYGSV